MTRMMTVGALIVTVFSRFAIAEVTDFKLFASSTVTQSRSGIEEERQQQSKGFPASQQISPVQTEVELTGKDDLGTLQWSALNRVVANDPQFNDNLPTDFVFNSAAASADPEVSLALDALARQTRTINVLQAEFPAFPPGQLLNLQSTFLLDGSLLAVVPTTAGSAQGLQMELGLQISKNEDEVFSGKVTLTGQEDGSVAVQAPQGFHANDFVFSSFTVPDLATVYLLTFDDEPVLYDYLARIDDTFDLAAEIWVDMTIPGGLAGGAAFGTVPAELILLTKDLFAQPPAAAKLAAPEPASFILLLLAAPWVLRRTRRTH